MFTTSKSKRVPPPVPDAAIDALLGQGFSQEGMKRELERLNYTWIPALKNRIIKREFEFFKDEIGRLLSANPEDSRKNILKQMKGKKSKHERDRRLAAGTLFTSDTSPRTFQQYIKRWKDDDPTYGAPVLPPSTAADMDTQDGTAAQLSLSGITSRQPMPTMTTQQYQNPAGNNSQWIQLSPAAGIMANEQHDYDMLFTQPTISPAQHLQQTHTTFTTTPFSYSAISPFDPMTTRGLLGGYSQQSTVDGSLSNNFDAQLQAGYHADFDQWDVEQTSMATPNAGLFISDSGLNEIYETAPSDFFVGGRPQQIPPQNMGEQPWSGMHTAQHGQHPYQEEFDETILRAVLTEEMNNASPGTLQSASSSPHDPPTDPTSTKSLNSASTLSRNAGPRIRDNTLPRYSPEDVEMGVPEYSNFSDDGDDSDGSVQASSPVAQVSRNPILLVTVISVQGLNVKVVKPPRKALRRSNSAAREMRLRQQCTHLKLKSRASSQELQEKKEEIVQKDLEILELAKRVKLLEILTTQTPQQTHEASVAHPNRSSSMDDIIYQDIVHQHRNDKIIQEARISKQRHIAQKEASEASFSGTATDDEQESASQKGCTSPSRHLSRSLPSKTAIPLGHALRFTAPQRSESTNSNVAETPSQPPSPTQSPMRRARGLVRKISDKCLGRHRESIPPMPILGQWKEVHDDIQKRYTGDSGYASLHSDTVLDMDLDPERSHHGNFI